MYFLEDIFSLKIFTIAVKIFYTIQKLLRYSLALPGDIFTQHHGDALTADGGFSCTLVSISLTEQRLKKKTRRVQHDDETMKKTRARPDIPQAHP